MRRLPGQAARLLWPVLHGAVTVVLTLALLAGTGFGVLAWRLGRGPIVLPWLIARIEAAADRALTPDRLRVGQVALAWEGFHGGLGAPIDLQLTGITVLDRGGATQMTVPRAAVALSLPALLQLRLAPRSIAIDHPRIVLQRTANGTIGIDVGTTAPSAPAQLKPPAGQALSVAPPTAAARTAPPGGRPALDPAKIFAELARPPARSREPSRFGLLSQLHRLLVRDANLEVIDSALGAVWRAPHAFLDLARAPDGGVSGRTGLDLSLGGTVADLVITARLPAGGHSARVAARLDRISPAALAGNAPGLAPLTAVDAPVGGTASFDLGANLKPRQIALALTAGPGQLHLAGGTVPILAAKLAASGTPEQIALDLLRVTLPGAPGTPPTVLDLRGTLARAGPTITAALGLHFDQVAFARLPALWPAGLATDARHWILGNFSGGEARDGVFSFGLAADADLSHIRLSKAAGTLHGTGLVVHWLRPVPPLVDGTAELSLHDPDRLDIAVSAGRQAAAPGQPAGLVVKGGTLRITGLSHHDQDMQIVAQIAGPLPAALALLKEPRLGLLARHPIRLVDPRGQAAGRLTLAFPLVKKLRIAQVQIGATATLSGVHLSQVVAGRDLNDGKFDLVADTDGLSLTGDGRLGGIPARLSGRMDFRAGPPDQVQQRLTATADTTAAALTAAGVSTLGLVSGPVDVAAVVTERRNGTGAVALRADLTGARLSVAALHWDKPPGRPARLTATLPLVHDRLEGTAPIALEDTAARADPAAPGRGGRGPGTKGAGAGDPRGNDPRGSGRGSGEAHGSALARGPAGDTVPAGANGALGGTARAGFVAGRLATLRLTRLRLGRTEVSGEVGFPEGGRPIAVRLSGPVLDLAARFTPRPTPRRPPAAPVRAAPVPHRGPPWTLAAHFAAVRLAGGVTLTEATATGANDGFVWQRLHLDARIGATNRLTARIDPAAAGTAPGRSLAIEAGDAGTLAHGLGLPGSLQGGTLAITGRYGPGPASELAGTVTLADFRLRDAPVVARLLQAVTLYGVVELMQGPGLGVRRLIAPFSLRGGVLTLSHARAFSPSLGATAAGTIDFDAGRINLNGTIVPAYFFNALLGRVPLVGRLFSPERGGGVFAASYAIHGALKDPTVSVNPLTALTPGFLRGLFNLF